MIEVNCVCEITKVMQSRSSHYLRQIYVGKCPEARRIGIRKFATGKTVNVLGPSERALNDVAQL